MNDGLKRIETERAMREAAASAPRTIDTRFASQFDGVGAVSDSLALVIRHAVDQDLKAGDAASDEATGRGPT
jgi:hypothetical protein